MLLAPLVGVGVRAVAAITITVTVVRPVTLTDADLVPGHLTTVFYDETCACRRVEVTPLVEAETGPLAPGTLLADTSEGP